MAVIDLKNGESFSVTQPSPAPTSSSDSNFPVGSASWGSHGESKVWMCCDDSTNICPSESKRVEIRRALCVVPVSLTPEAAIDAGAREAAAKQIGNPILS